jgi:hypothetical protein
MDELCSLVDRLTESQKLGQPVAEDLSVIQLNQVLSKLNTVLRQSLQEAKVTVADDMSLHANEQGLRTFLDINYWRSLCPHLHIADTNFQENFLSSTRDSEFKDLNHLNTRVSLCQAQTAVLSQRLCDEGYFVLSRPTLDAKLDYDKLIGLLREGIEKLHRMGWPATMIYLYDEAWCLGHSISNLLGEVSGGNSLSMDFYAWRVDPRIGQKGWGPHRDRMGSDASSFHPASRRIRAEKETKIDHKIRSEVGQYSLYGPPKFTTCWIPLTDASPDNSCLCVIPAPADPNYHKGDEPNVNFLTEMFSKPENFQHIRALPAVAGSLINFGHRVIHWGSQGRPSAPQEIPVRIAISFTFSDPGFERPFLGSEHLPFPEFELRLALMSSQMIAYQGNAPLSSFRSKQYYAAFNARRHFLSPVFADKVEYLYWCRPPPSAAQPPKITKPIASKQREWVPSSSDDEDKGFGVLEGLQQISSAEEDSDEHDELRERERINKNELAHHNLQSLE